MGEMLTIKVLRQQLKEWMLPDEMKISWDAENREEVQYAAKKFREYLNDGWMAFSDESKGRRQIFTFDPNIKRIVLTPPLGGG